MNYLELLKDSSLRFNSLVCLGLDPVIDDIPITSGSIGDRIKNFYGEILNTILKKKIFPSAVKPNYAFYAQYGIEGIEALRDVCGLYQSEGFPVILDSKRGDIGKTAAAYARETFDFLKADAVTLSPYLGYDSIEPFVSGYPEKGYYILNKTSNKSSSEIQDIQVSGVPLYLHISKRIVEWYHPGVGAVTGATFPEQLSNILEIFIESGKEVPLLIPGVGTQGGRVDELVPILKKSPDIGIHRINSSSAINYAYKRYQDLRFPEAAVRALEELNTEIMRNIDKK